MLLSKNVEYLMEAHNGLSARIVQETGFKGIWASGLGISAQLGVRDSNEASWTQVLDVVEFMSDSSQVPILLDADTGYGNFNNARRLVRKLEQRGIAGACIEDKLFPKTNSLLDGRKQPLAELEEFALKIKVTNLHVYIKKNSTAFTTTKNSGKFRLFLLFILNKTFKLTVFSCSVKSNLIVLKFRQ